MKKSPAFLLLILCFLPLRLMAQSCSTAICNAATCNEPDVLAALPSNTNTNATVTVNIPSGACTWTTHIAYTVPAAVTNLTIQGVTVITWSGTAGTSSWSPSVSGTQTTITDQVASNDYFWSITTGAANTFLTISGISWTSTTGAQYNKYSNGFIHLTGASQNVRFGPSNYINNSTGQLQNEWVQIDNQSGLMPTGVADHNYFFNFGGNSFGDNDIRVFGASDDTIGFGDGSWVNGTQFGTQKPFYMESNYFYGGASNDCVRGGRFVERYNTFDSMYVAIQTHGTKTPGGSDRACNSFEAYKNYVTISGSNAEADGSFGAKGGTALIYNNTQSAGTAFRFYAASVDRNGGDSASETNPPQGWGYCGTTTPNPPGGSTPNGVGSGWDGNQTAAAGWPCLDGLGRGQDAQALNGQPLPNRLNAATGTIAWPHQYLEPIYMWNNSIGAATYINIRDLVTTDNRDYYYDSSQNPDCSNAAFNGICGTGFGLLSARPNTCTAGLGGAYGTSPTGSYGVAYFATDANGGNGELYVCTSTNTWTGIYQPFTYPHPLIGGGGTTFTFTLAQTGTGFGTVTGSTSGTYPIGALISVTVAPWVGSTYSWSGVSGCTSSTPTCSFTLNSNTTLTLTLSTGSGPFIAAQANNGVTPSTTVPLSVTAGHNAYAEAFLPGPGNSGATITFTDSQSNSWTTIASGNITTDGDTIVIGCASVASTGTDTITTKAAGVAATMLTIAVDAGQASCTPDQTASANYQTSTTAPTSNSVTITVASDFLLGAHGISSPSTSPLQIGSGPLQTGGGFINPQSVGSAAGGVNYYSFFGQAQAPGATGTYISSINAVPSSEANSLLVAFLSNPTCGNPTQLGPNFSNYPNSYPTSSLPLSLGFSSPTPGCVMHFTTASGTTAPAPTCASPTYPSGGFTISTSGVFTYRVIACQLGFTPSSVQGGTWQVAAATTYSFTVSSTGSGSCTFSGSNCANNAAIPSGSTVACQANPATGSAFVSWLGTGSAPSGTANPNPFVIASASTLQATCNQIAAAAPTASPNTPPNIYPGSVTVSLSDATAGATIKYCVTGAPPCNPSITYTGPLLLNNPPAQYIYAFATASGFLQSPTSNFSYILIVPPTNVKGVVINGAQVQ